MPDGKHDPNAALDDNAMDAKNRMEALARAIYEEMRSLTQEELERLYAMAVLMEQKRDEWGCQEPKDTPPHWCHPVVLAGWKGLGRQES